MAAQFPQTMRSLAGDRSRYAIVTWTGAGLLMAAWTTWFVFGSVTVYEVSQHARLEVRRAPHPIAAPVAGTVVSSSLAIGAEVHEGDVLVSLDDSSERLRLREARTRLDAIPQQLASLTREIEAREREKIADRQSASAAAEAARFKNREAAAAADGAQDYERRVRALGAGGLVSALDVKRAATDSERLTATRDSMTADLGRLELDARTHAGQHDAAIEDLRHTVTQLQGDMTTARATIAVLQADIEKHVVRAPIGGRVGDVTPIQTGAYVAAGQPLATIVPSGELMIAADFSPSLTLGRVRAGQHARLRLDGFPWAEYGSVPAIVTRVATEIRDGAVRVELAVDRATATRVPMQHGLPGVVEVGVEQVSPAVLVLRSAGLVIR